jgi:hypothetical protein
MRQRAFVDSKQSRQRWMTVLFMNGGNTAKCCEDSQDFWKSLFSATDIGKQKCEIIWE